MSASILQVEDLWVAYPIRRSWLGRVVERVHAVRGVSLALAPGETVALVGESGCGKSSLARAIAQLVPVERGRVLVEGTDWCALSERRLRPLRPAVQMVFQDPYASLNPRMRVGAILEEPLIVHGRGDRTERRRRVREMLEAVGLEPSDAERFPHAFSGGQRQRIGIARALILEPRVLVADEAVSALDVSVQAQVLNLLLDLQERRRFAMLFISHDLRVVERIADRVAVMYLGEIVELAPTARLFATPRHPYTRALLDAVPVPDPRHRHRPEPLPGEPPSPLAPPSGCAFHPRCPFADDRCRAESPPSTTVEGHTWRCHHPLSRPA